MLHEIEAVRQIPGEPKRRWFNSPDLDLIVWQREDGEPCGFQLCYDKGRGERALTWRDGVGFEHRAVDDGESTAAKMKATPILVPDGAFPRERVLRLFAANAGQLPEAIAAYVAEKMKAGSVFETGPASFVATEISRRDGAPG
jgi:hypothetical protein